jgi:hypothetical protein
LLRSRADGAAAASPRGGGAAVEKAADVHYAPVDLRMSRAQCTACTADLSCEAGAGWKMEVVVQRELAPRMRKKRERPDVSHRRVGARAAAEELLSLGEGALSPPSNVRFWSVAPGATISHLGGDAAACGAGKEDVSAASTAVGSQD